MTYENFFRRATRSGSALNGLKPFPYQNRLADGNWPELLDIPTGLGKTAGVVLAWLWKRGWRAGGERATPNEDTPRRLVYCLPMRVLVEQTHASTVRWLKALDCLAEPGQGQVSVHQLMGGTEGHERATWAEHPEEDAILIGTQDMLLSRALMRGYGMSRYQWPVHFAFLHNDALWVYDEVQLMGAGLPTSAQLEAFRRTFPMGKRCRSLWMSATLNAEWFSTVDFRAHIEKADRLSLTTAEKKDSAVKIRREAKKDVARADTRLKADDAKGRLSYAKDLAGEVLQRHRPGSNALVILNTVDRAQAVFQAIQKLSPSPPVLLVHARFRPKERSSLNLALSQAAPDTGCIIIATQAIEAGVDISSSVLFTEVAPWASLVQRFGRCNRYGEYNKEHAEVFWVDIGAEEELARPYTLDEIKQSTKRLKSLESASPGDLPQVDEAAPNFPILRRKDFLDFFNTDPDITGFDVDVSGYIRDADDLDVQVFWRDLSAGVDGQPQPRREELCRASLSQLKRYLDRIKKKDTSAWRWDSLSGKWTRYSGAVRPGLTLMLDAAAGGYDPKLGFAPEAPSPVTVLDVATADSEETYDGDWRSFQQHAVQLATHLVDVEDEAGALASKLALSDEQTDALKLAGRWHDLGKAHSAFQGMLHLADKKLDSSALWAKAGDGEGKRTRPRYRIETANGSFEERRYFRHELASMLAWIQHRSSHRSSDLIAYLIAAHHGKVRTSLRALPDEKGPPEFERRYARGVWDGDSVPAFAISNREQVPESSLRLEIMEMGDGAMGPSWANRVARLLKEHGPFQLAWMEALVRIADWRASRKEQEGKQ